MKILFIYESGSPAYGIPAPADVDLRIVYVPDNLADLFRPKSVPKERKSGLLDATLVPLDHYLRLLIKPNINYAEWLYGEHLLAWDEKVEDLRTAIKPNWKDDGIFVLDAVHHFHGMLQHTLYHAKDENYEKPKRLLYALRIYMQGIVFFRKKELGISFRELFPLFKPSEGSLLADDCEMQYEELCQLKMNEEAPNSLTKERIKLSFAFLEDRLEEAHQRAKDDGWADSVSETVKEQVADIYASIVEPSISITMGE